MAAKKRMEALYAHLRKVCDESWNDGYWTTCRVRNEWVYRHPKIAPTEVDLFTPQQVVARMACYKYQARFTKAAAGRAAAHAALLAAAHTPGESASCLAEAAEAAEAAKAADAALLAAQDKVDASHRAALAAKRDAEDSKKCHARQQQKQPQPQPQQKQKQPQPQPQQKQPQHKQPQHKQPQQKQKQPQSLETLIRDAPSCPAGSPEHRRWMDSVAAYLGVVDKQGGGQKRSILFRLHPDRRSVADVPDMHDQLYRIVTSY